MSARVDTRMRARMSTSDASLRGWTSLSWPETGSAPDDGRILSKAGCQSIMAQLAKAAAGDGSTVARISSDWIAGVRWGRNTILNTFATSDARLSVERELANGRNSSLVITNETTDNALVAVVRRAERFASARDLPFIPALLEPYVPVDTPLSPALFDDATYAQSGAERVQVAEQLIADAEAAGMVSAGYLEVSAHTIARLDSAGRALYYQYTWAQCSVTVRDPLGTGSGWAGVDWSAWGKINTAQLGKIALDKCLRSRNPVRVEPGRYTTILEPQAVFDLMSVVFGDISKMDRQTNERESWAMFWQSWGMSMLGQQVADPRVTIGSDPMDPDLGFPPFWTMPSADAPIAHVYFPVTLIKDGVLVTLPYDKEYAGAQLGQPTGRLFSGAFRMSGGTTAIAEMIATTKRGLVVTRFDNVELLDSKSALVRGYTRDGTWFVEDGKITKPVTNLAATESVLFLLNNVEQLGVPQRIFNAPITWQQGLAPVLPQPAIVPPLKIRDFSFTALIDAV